MHAIYRAKSPRDQSVALWRNLVDSELTLTVGIAEETVIAVAAVDSVAGRAAGKRVVAAQAVERESASSADPNRRSGGSQRCR
jgi:hypothetical protein